MPGGKTGNEQRSDAFERQLNAGFPVDRLSNLITAALEEHRRALQLHEEAWGDLLELTTVGLRAFGHLRAPADLADA